MNAGQPPYEGNTAYGNDTMENPYAESSTQSQYYQCHPNSGYGYAVPVQPLYPQSAAPDQAAYLSNVPGGHPYQGYPQNTCSLPKEAAKALDKSSDWVVALTVLAVMHLLFALMFR